MDGPAYSRLTADERRRRLLALGTDLFTRLPYDELTMARVAREAGITTPLLYHYFPNKEAFFEEVLLAGFGDLAAATEPDSDLPPFEALRGSVDAYLTWVADHRGTYETFLRSSASIPAVGRMLATIRDTTAERILDGLGGDQREDPRTRMAVRSWLWQMDGAIHDWLEHDDIEQETLRGFLLGALAASIAVAGAQAGSG